MTTATASAGVLELIDPQTIDVATNVRTAAEASLDKELSRPGVSGERFAGVSPLFRGVR